MVLLVHWFEEAAASVETTDLATLPFSNALGKGPGDGVRKGLDSAMKNSEPNNKDGWPHTHTDRAIYRDIQERARLMRQNPTRAEKILWQRLRGKQVGGFHFRRQHPIGRFIVDFYCASARLVVEVDGAVHNEPGHAEYDEDRQRFLQASGLRVLRFSNAQVVGETDAVVEVIAESVGCMC